MIISLHSNLKRCALAFACLLYAGLGLSADTRDVRQLRAAEDIKVVSQQITKAYFYIHQKIRVKHATKDLNNGLIALDRDIKILSAGSADEEQKSMLLFLQFTHDELKDTVNKPYSKERGALMLDYSETLLEGAELLAKKHTHKNDKKEQMLIITERMKFLLERITKYYIAFRGGFNDHNNVVQLEQAIKEYESNLAIVKAFNYPSNLKRTVHKLVRYWPLAKKFYLGVEKNELPLIVFVSTQNMEKSLHKLESYHYQSIRKE